MLIREHNREHFIITNIPEIFESAAFIDFSHKLSVHMAEQDHANDVKVDVIFQVCWVNLTTNSK